MLPEISESAVIVGELCTELGEVRAPRRAHDASAVEFEHRPATQHAR